MVSLVVTKGVGKPGVFFGDRKALTGGNHLIINWLVVTIFWFLGSKNFFGGFNHPEKYEFVNGKDDIPYIMDKKCLKL